jgi:hypothetical protein
MAAKKKTKKKRTNKRTGKKTTPTNKPANKKLARKKGSRNKKSAKKKTPQKKAAVKTKAAARKTRGGNTVSALEKRIRDNDQTVDTAPFSPRGSRAPSGGQAGDLQGLSDREVADSESVDELLEEGNAFEADVVTGVEDAGNADEGEVHTHEVPEDDVPEEYLDKDE